MKRIAIASSDGECISSHFGRSMCFLIYEADGDTIVRKEVRANTHACSEHVGCGHGEGHAHGEHRGHADLMELLRDCEAVIAGGMGSRAAQELKQNGITPLMVNSEAEPDAAAAAYFSGQVCGGDHTCTCSH
ncbi:MAG: NifB/NifX family molybdenum-iron cluster-binding protein [Candidatus Hydrogenedentales bacterium]|jgi:predicted Fe-Mo cluster-binding NifX family protein